MGLRPYREGLALGLLAGLLLPACGSTTTSTSTDAPDVGAPDVGAPTPPLCVVGRSKSCGCPDGRTGAQVCASDGTFGACICTAPPESDAGVVTPNLDVPPADVPVAPIDVPVAPVDVPAPTEAGSVDAGSAPSITIGSSTTQSLVDAFAVPAGIIVVTADAVVLRGRDGAEIARWTSAREITAAAFDGTYLAVADRAAMTALSPALAVLGTANVTDACAQVVFVGGARAVCGPANDWDRVFDTYQLPAMRRLNRSAPFTYHGIPMRRVPGRDDFTTVTTGLSPSDINVYRVAASHAALYMGESPYHGAFPVTNTYAFVGLPATHVVTVSGVILDIYPPTCVPMDGRFGTGCFVRDGNLGTLRSGESFVALTEVSATAIAALVGTGTGFSSPACAGGCTLQRIEVAARTVTSTRAHTIAGVAAVVVARHDPYADRFVLGFRSGSDPFRPAGYRVELLAY
ncbi:MAG: hypothetical protein Q8S73_12180 [Deltaproteobacteria bacterium]|nr:hypothetical protein [Myxococcales bacterium]MDP3214856.1 hypothetical protein [Deltaproteobacteria bacterium]